MQVTTEAIKITGKPTKSQNICQFQVNRELHSGEPLRCEHSEQAKGSPLLEALFSLGGIAQVMVTQDTITVDKASDESWKIVGKKIGTVIREELEKRESSGNPLISPDFQLQYNNASLTEQFQDILDTHVNPGIAVHGGSIELVEIKGETAYIKMNGGCQGCSAAMLTLKLSVERTIISKLPSITKIVDVTNHAEGTNPYQ